MKTYRLGDGRLTVTEVFDAEIIDKKMVSSFPSTRNQGSRDVWVELHRCGDLWFVSTDIRGAMGTEKTPRTGNVFHNPEDARKTFEMMCEHLSGPVK